MDSETIVTIIIFLIISIFVLESATKFVKEVGKLLRDSWSVFLDKIFELIKNEFITPAGKINVIIMVLLTILLLAYNVPSFLEKIGLYESDNIDPFWSLVIWCTTGMVSLYIVNAGKFDNDL